MSPENPNKAPSSDVLNGEVGEKKRISFFKKFFMVFFWSHCFPIDSIIHHIQNTNGGVP
jgi:hypothetical protein